MLRMNAKMLLAMVLTAIMTACEKPYVVVEEPVPGDDKANVLLRVTGFDTLDFDDTASTRTDVDITQLCSRLNFVIYDGETKLKSIAQKKDDPGFGSVALSLPQGTYKVAIIGHNSDGTATITTLDKISFKNNIVTDTFLFCDDLEVTGEQQSVDIELRRVVAMFRLALSQPLPAEVRQLKFYYTGGSSTLSAVTGYGSVNSKQTVILNVESGQTQFDVYTIPHAETGKLKITITALDATETPLHERVFEEVAIQRCKITRYIGNFFEDSPTESGGLSFRMRAAEEWEGEDTFTF